MSLNCHPTMAWYNSLTLSRDPKFAPGFQAVAADGAFFIRTLVGNGLSSMIVNVPALQAAIGIPQDMVQSTNGDLYVVSKNFHVVLRVELNKPGGTSLVTVVAGNGSPAFSGDNVSATENPLGNLMSVLLIENSSGEVTDLIIAEANYHRIRKVNSGQ
mgnify:CR=1 FL=1